MDNLQECKSLEEIAQWMYERRNYDCQSNWNKRLEQALTHAHNLAIEQAAGTLTGNVDLYGTIWGNAAEKIRSLKLDNESKKDD